MLAACPAPLLLAAPASAAAAKHYDDFNGDGYRDLAVPYAYSGIEDGTVSFSGGAVLVTFGGPKGLTTKTQLVHQDSPGVPGAGEDNDQFGGALASADLDRDGYADLVVGNPSEESGKTPVGSVTVVWGSAKGLKGGTALPRKGSGAFGAFGRDIATGDFNGDGFCSTSRPSTPVTSCCTGAGSPSPAASGRSARTTGRSRAGTPTAWRRGRSPVTGRPTWSPSGSGVSEARSGPRRGS